MKQVRSFSHLGIILMTHVTLHLAKCCSVILWKTCKKSLSSMWLDKGKRNMIYQSVAISFVDLKHRIFIFTTLRTSKNTNNQRWNWGIKLGSFIWFLDCINNKVLKYTNQVLELLLIITNGQDMFSEGRRKGSKRKFYILNFRKV